MNVFKRIAEMAQNRFMNTENGRSSNSATEEEEDLDHGVVTPQNVFRAPIATYAPQRRLTAVTRYVSRREQIVLNTVSSNDSTGVGGTDEVASTSAVPTLIVRSNSQSRSHQRHSFQIQVCYFVQII